MFDNNLYMIFKFNPNDLIDTFGSVITQKAFDTFIGSNQGNNVRLVEEDVTLPTNLLGGTTRRALVQYLNDKRFAAYIPVFPTKAEIDAYNAAFGR